MDPAGEPDPSPEDDADGFVVLVADPVTGHCDCYGPYRDAREGSGRPSGGASSTTSPTCPTSSSRWCRGTPRTSASSTPTGERAERGAWLPLDVSDVPSLTPARGD